MLSQKNIEIQNAIILACHPGCSVSGCSLPHLAKGYCNKHYQRYKKQGDPLYSKINRGEGNSKVEAFYSRILINNTSGCHERIGSRNLLGYGVCRMLGEHLSHRVARKIKNGDIEKGAILMHSCDNPRYCNIQHLSIGTHKENTQDKINKGRINVCKGEKHGSAKLSYNDVCNIKDLFKKGIKKYAEIGKMFGVSKYMIGRIKRGENWNF